METMRLRRIQHPAEVERLLESYIHRANILPKDADQIRIAGSVPRELRGLVMQAVKLGKTWSCWTRGSETWLFTAEMSLELSRERGAPVLQINLTAATARCVNPLPLQTIRLASGSAAPSDTVSV